MSGRGLSDRLGREADEAVLFGLADDRRSTGELARAVGQVVQAEEAETGRRVRRRLHATVVVTDADVAGFDPRSVDAAVTTVREHPSLRSSLVGVVPVDAETRDGDDRSAASAGCGGVERVADRLQLSVLDAVMRTSYALAGASGSVPRPAAAKMSEAIERLDGIARELLDLIVELRAAGGQGNPR
jgi:hypothetical protein